jgi:predicted transcriptional regulator
VSSEEDVECCLFLMREHNFRHLPVMNKETKEVVGLVSMKDILWREFEETRREHSFMRAYVSGVRNF